MRLSKTDTKDLISAILAKQVQLRKEPDDDSAAMSKRLEKLYERLKAEF